MVSGHIEGITDTMPLRVDKLFHGASESSAVAAFVVASLLALLALITLVLKTILEWKQERDHALAQRAAPDDTVDYDQPSSDFAIAHDAASPNIKLSGTETAAIKSVSLIAAIVFGSINDSL